MSYNNLDDYYRKLSPTGTSSEVKKEKSTDRKSIHTILSEVILNAGGQFYTYDEIKDSIDSYFTGKDSQENKETKTEVGLHFHGLGPSRIDLDDKDYWDSIESSKKLVKGPDDFSLSTFVIKHPYVTPALRGTESIEFFLNYTPSIVTAQMLPHFEVEFHVRRPGGNKDFLDSPGIMRFLLGSVDTSKLSDPDKILSNTGVRMEDPKKDPKNEKKIKATISGMEMFLAPQTLSYDMDSLTARKEGRLVPAKPFVPFGSVDGFDVTINNAGAGSFAHKKANLKLKIHDKGRIGEFSEFFRGEPGFSEVTVWTTYGWIAPRNMAGTLNDYAGFINENMLIRECWKITNPQFTFDQSGQVSVSIEMVSAGAKDTQGLTVCEADEKIKNFHRIIQEISELKKKAAGSEGLSLPVTAEQFLNAASTNGIFKNLKDIDGAVKSIITSLKASGNLSPDEIKKFEEDVSDLRGENSYDKFKAFAAEEVKKKFDSLARSKENPDPFLPVEEKMKFYEKNPRSKALIKEIKRFIETNSTRNNAVSGVRGKKVPKADNKRPEQTADPSKSSSGPTRGQQAGAVPAPETTASPAPAKPTEKKKPASVANNVTNSLGLKADVVSFGKLFTTFVAPSIAETRKVKELQIMFYQVNDSCGPMSSLSIAEFPINVTDLALSYNDALKSGKVDSLGIDAFLKLVIESQITNKASIAYGMNRFYKSVDENGETKKVLSDDRDAKDGMEKWVDEYGVLRPPVIEMYIETATAGARGKDVIGSLKRDSYKGLFNVPNQGKTREDTIMRIHIYDRTNNPYTLVQKVLNTGTSGAPHFETGEADTTKLTNYIKSLKDKKDKAALDKIRENFNKGKKDYKEALKASGVPEEEVNSLVVNKETDTIKITGDKEEYRNFLQRSVPTINVGTNGSLVLSVNVASKTDGLIGASNLIKANKGGPSKATLNNNGLEMSDTLPLRVVPVQLTMTTMGVPIAQLYQTYFMNFDTGTSLDNIYSCSQLQHSISQGKFTTSWTFIYTDGYGKFGAPPGIMAAGNKKLESLLKEFEESSAVKPTRPGQPARPAQTSRNASAGDSTRNPGGQTRTGR